MNKLVSKAGAVGLATTMLLSSGVFFAASAQNNFNRIGNGTVDQCSNGGWQDFTTSNGTQRFSSEAQCVSSFNNGSVNGRFVNDTFNNSFFNDNIFNNNDRNRVINFLIQLRNQINSFLRSLLF